MLDFKNWCLNQGYDITERQLDQFVQFKENLLDWNKRINLTAITADNDIWQKHFADSLTLLPFLKGNASDTNGSVTNASDANASDANGSDTNSSDTNISVIDIGTGAGFPGLPIKIMRPDINITLLDSLRKRINFLEDTINRLGFDIRCIHSRAEDLSKNAEHRGRYQIATARAVAKLDKLCKWSLPFLEPGGIFLAMKGPKVEDEVKEAEPVIRKLGGEVREIVLMEIVPGMVHSVVVVCYNGNIEN